MSAPGSDDEALELLTVARMAHRHAAHGYHTARAANKKAAGEVLDNAAITFAMAAAACGARGLR